MQRTRALAGANEALDITHIIASLKGRTPAGMKLMGAFTQRFSKNIYDARPRTRGGNRGSHYDFQVLVGTEQSSAAWANVEHKGSRLFRPIGADETPWAAGVQFHNGPCEKYAIAQQFARRWYDTHVGSGTLKAAWGVEAAIPSFEEWFAGDAKVQGDPTTAFGVELKSRVRAKLGGKRSLTAARAAVIADFHPTEDDLALFKKETLDTLNAALAEKHYWLTIHGEPTGDFHCAWYPPFSLGAIDEVRVEKQRDIWFHFRCGDFRFKSILRWGKGAGFSNLRIDAR